MRQGYQDNIKNQVCYLNLDIEKDTSWKRQYTPESYTPVFKHLDFQAATLEATWDYKKAALFLDMGLGKSKVTIDTACLLYLNEQIEALLVIAPKGVYGNWVHKELIKHIPQNIEFNTVQWTGTINQGKIKEFENLLSPKIPAILNILVMNIDATMPEGKASSGKGYFLAEQFLKTYKTLMVIDESTKIKNPKAKRSCAVYDLGLLAKYKRILTGSPITKNPLDIYSQSAFLGKELLGFSNYFAFRNRYAIVEQKHTFGGRMYPVEVGFQNEDELSKKLARYSIRLTKEQCLDLPDKQYITRCIELTPEQKKYYKQLQKEALIVLDDDEVSVTIVLTQILRFRQICCGFLTTDAGNTIDIKCNKLSELEELLEEINGKVIIWSHFVDQGVLKIASLIEKTYGKKSYVTFYGGTKDRQTPVERFENDPECRFFIANPAVGGMGLTLNAANYVIFYDNDYDLEKRQQAETRNYRIGQKNKVTYIDLTTIDTIEEDIVEALIKKYEISAKILRDKLLQWLKK